MDTRVFVFLAIVFAMCKGCSVLEPNARSANSLEAYEVKVYYSDIVVFGKVGEIVTGDYPFSNISGVFTRTFKLFCIFKGKHYLHSLTDITIVGFGNENKQIVGCPNSTVNTNDEVIMFLKSPKQTTVFELEFAPISGDTSNILDELSLVCGLQKDTGDTCADFVPADEDCIQYVTSSTYEVASHQQPTSTPAPLERETSTQKPINDQTVIEASVKDDKMINNEVESSNDKYMKVSDNKCCSISADAIFMLLCVSALLILPV